ncbi:hypothetical protein Acsp02_90450 [Actinoplanes sp. NBRC 103695]|nr:hypothetical protein Acsp02_90450 [Actinoplanes sp. NBRC 103695]
MGVVVVTPPYVLQTNPVWAALTGPQCALAMNRGDAVRVSPGGTASFAAVRDHLESKAWDDLRYLMGPGEVCTLVTGSPVAPTGWEVIDARSAVQMVRDPGPSPAAVELVEEFEVPGFSWLGPPPWSPVSTVRRWRRPVAAAGERLRVSGWVEVVAAGRSRSAVAAAAAAAVVRAEKRGDHAFFYAGADDVRLLDHLDRKGFLLCATGWFTRLRHEG